MVDCFRCEHVSRRLQEKPLVSGRVSTCRSKGPDGELIERGYGYVIASHSLQVKVKNMEVVEDFESRPHKAVTFLVERDKEFQVLCEQEMPKALPGISGGKLPGRSKVEKRKRKKKERRKAR